MPNANRKGSFKAGLRNFEKEFNQKSRRNVRKILLAGLGGVISSSPVDTAMFRLNWTVSVGEPERAAEEEGYYEPSGDKSPIPASPEELTPAEDVRFKMGDVIYISNALPYSNRIEGGWSKQAPGGVVAPVIRELETKIEGGALD